MPGTPKLVYECPSIENTVLVDSYQALYPARYSLEDDDKHVLHAGGKGYQVSLDMSRVSYIDAKLVQVFGSSVTLFVLNSTFVIWSESEAVGLELPYQLIAVHALKDIDDVLALYLQIIPCSLFSTNGHSEYVETLEVLITEGPSLREFQGEPVQPNHDPDTSNLPNKKFMDYLFPQTYSMQGLYNALSTCSALHYDSDSDSDGFNSPSSWITKDTASQLEVPSHWINSGVADDLGMDAQGEEEGDAGMNIDLGETAVIGLRRRNSDALGELANSKVRRVS